MRNRIQQSFVSLEANRPASQRTASAAADKQNGPAQLSTQSLVREAMAASRHGDLLEAISDSQRESIADILGADSASSSARRKAPQSSMASELIVTRELNSWAAQRHVEEEKEGGHLDAMFAPVSRGTPAETHTSAKSIRERLSALTKVETDERFIDVDSDDDDNIKAASKNDGKVSDTSLPVAAANKASVPAATADADNSNICKPPTDDPLLATRLLPHASSALSSVPSSQGLHEAAPPGQSASSSSFSESVAMSFMQRPDVAPPAAGVTAHNGNATTSPAAPSGWRARIAASKSMK